MNFTVYNLKMKKRKKKQGKINMPNWGGGEKKERKREKRFSLQDLKMVVHFWR